MAWLSSDTEGDLHKQVLITCMHSCTHPAPSSGDHGAGSEGDSGARALVDGEVGSSDNHRRLTDGKRKASKKTNELSHYYGAACLVCNRKLQLWRVWC